MALAFLAISVIIATGRPQAQAADFAFRLQFGCDSSDILDTFNGSFTRWWHSDPPPPKPVTIPVSLSAEQMREISEAVERIRFFDYPADFKGVRADANEVVTTSPSVSYRFEVRSARRLHNLSWDDKAKPSSEEADRLRALFRMIIGFIEEHPDVKRLPGRLPCE